MEFDRRGTTIDKTLDMIRGRVDAATGLPWAAHPEGPGNTGTSFILTGGAGSEHRQYIEIPGGPGEDLHFIVSSRASIPTLLSQFSNFTMSEPELREIKASFNRVSKNPWIINIPDPADPENGELHYTTTNGEGPPIDLYVADAEPADLEFIVHCRDDMAFLLTRVENLFRK